MNTYHTDPAPRTNPLNSGSTPRQILLGDPSGRRYDAATAPEDDLRRTTSLESVIENSKEGYYLGPRQTQGTIRTDAPNWQPWLMFFLRALQQQKRRLAVNVEREKIVMAALPELAVQIVDHARQHGRVTMGDMIKVTGASRNTLK